MSDMPHDHLDATFTELYDELRGLAESSLRRERAGHTLQPTALANEAYLRLSRQAASRWESRAYFLGAAATVIRRVLVDHARARTRLKRGRGWEPVPLDDVSAPLVAGVDVLDLDEAMNELHELHPRHARVVELRYFGGLSLNETAGVLGVTTRTINRDWRVARSWLRSRLGSDVDVDRKAS